MLCNWLQIYYKTLLKPIIYEKKSPLEDGKMKKLKDGKMENMIVVVHHISIFPSFNLLLRYVLRNEI